MKVLVTGAAGFIGSNLCEALVAREHEVVGFDDLSQGSRENLDAVAGSPAFALRVGDVRDEGALTAAARGCEAIVHLAAFKIPRYTDAYDTLMINGMGSEIVARVAAETGAKVVAASTSDVYGKQPELPFRETADSVIGPPDVKRWAYAISKMFEEQLLLACHERFGLDVVLLRLFGAYGPRQHRSWWGGPQAVFIEKALRGEALPLHGDGAQTRSFTYVSDHVDGFVAALEGSGADNQVLNLGATEEVTIADLARLVWRLVRGEDDPPRLELIPYETFGRYEDVRRRVPDISRARELLGFAPKVALTDGMAATVRWQAGVHAAAA